MIFKKKQQPPRREVAASRRRNDGLDNSADATPQSYRRNRTLNSRQTSSPLETSERLAVHDLIKKRRRGMRRLFVVGCALVVIIVPLLQLTINLSVQTPDSRSHNNVEKYKKVINDYYGLRPAERFRFFLNHDDLAGYFLEKAPEVKTVRIEGDGLASSSMKLIFRQPVAQWSSGDKTYFVDENGITFEQNYFDSPEVAVRDESGIPAEGGKEVINRQFLSFLGQAVSLFEQNGLKVSEAVLPSGTVRQVWFKLDGRDYHIKMTIDRDAKPQVDQAVATIGYLDKQGSSIPSYIDVRVDQRSFYK